MEAFDSPPAFNLRKRAIDDVEQEEEKNSDDLPTSGVHKRRAQIPTTVRALSPLEKHISRMLKGADIDKNLSLRVLTAAFRIQKDYLEARRKKGVDKKSVRRPMIRAQVCGMFGISERSFSKIMQSYLINRKIYASGWCDSGRGGNISRKDTRIPRTNAVEILVRQWVRERRAIRQRTTARQVLDFLVDQQILFLPEDRDLTSVKAGLRAVQRWLQYYGYRRGRQTGNIVPNPQQTLKRHHYLTSFFNNRSLPPDERLLQK